ncbi:flippase-like domain-containing protein [Rubrobacter taiwanensis]|uniref:Flippase-like domain-containing protein n=1 Tax=Rubrobacter taiwanensis TaxID=185139 RepID=A0A4R1BEN2_9ACTN|nr:lysylphosphatidylglycerol synthase transmembrane domain-containing protein [Rubrobacter taiwanensis]TCJ15589.1 flippase-like domain-containing protein [Rubrobacter taiwanensis]
MKLRLLLLLAGFAVLLAAAVAVSPEAVRQAVYHALRNPLGLSLAFAAYTGAFVLRALAWRELLRDRIPLRWLFSLLLAALFLNHAAPAKAGDFARMYAAARRGVPAERAVASVVLSRVADLLGLLVVLAGAWALAGGARWGAVALPAAVVLAGWGGLWLLARIELPSGVARRAARLQAALRETTGAALLRALAFAASAWVLEAGILLFVARGLGMDLPLSAVVAASCLAVLAAAVPLTPGSVGTYEAGMVAALVALGQGASLALAAAVISHALKFFYALAAAPCALGEGVSVAQAREVRDASRVRV